MFEPGQKVYLIGIKGTGMTALAQVLQTWGCLVSGSDTAQHYFTDEVLKGLRIPYQEGFAVKNLPADVSLVVRSAAYDEDNIEVTAALQRRLPVLTYPEAVGVILNAAKQSVGVCGSHGKTTSTALLGAVLQEAGLRPTVLVGTSVPEFGGHNALAGRRDLAVAELCEYRRHFLSSKPKIVILTNIDWDHPDSAKTKEDYERAFSLFLQNLSPDSTIIFNGDDENCRRVINQPEIQKRFSRLVSFGFGGINDWRAERILAQGSQKNGGQVFKVFHNGVVEGEFNLRLIGEHNIRNALGVLAAASLLNVDRSLASAVFARFVGSKRRFEHKGVINGVDIFDDYAHHPTEIAATLKAARERLGKLKIWVVFQPHTYSRTATFLDDFAKSFTYADVVIVNEVFASVREKAEKPTVTSETLVTKMKRHKSMVSYIPGFSETAAYLKEQVRSGDVVITMGAGDAYLVGEMLLKDAKVVGAPP